MVMPTPRVTTFRFQGTPVKPSECPPPSTESTSTARKDSVSPTTRGRRATQRPGISRRRLPKAAVESITSRTVQELLTECGCIVLPFPLFTLLGSKDKCVICDRHGKQRVVRRAKPREITNEVLGVPLEYEPPPLPDKPPF